MMNSKMCLVRLSFIAMLAIGLSSCSGNGDTKKEHSEKENTTEDTSLGTIIANMQSQLPINCGGGLFLNAIEQPEDQVRFVCSIDGNQIDFSAFASAMQMNQESFLSTMRSTDESIDLLCLAIKGTGKELVFRFRNTSEPTYFDLKYPSAKL